MYNKSTGYMYVCLRDMLGNGNTKAVHRLVALAFLPNPKGLEQVDHINNNRRDNVQSNLRWISRKDNNSRKHARMLKSKHAKVTPKSHLFVKATKGEEVKYFKNARRTAMGIGCSHVLVIKVLRGEFSQACGWKLEYLDRKSEEFKNSGIDVETQSHKNRMLSIRMGKERKEFLKHKLLELSIDLYTSHIGIEEAKSRLSQMKRDLHVVLQCSEDGEIVKEWKNALTAQKELGINNIYTALRGMKPTAGGYIWKYKVA